MADTGVKARKRKKRERTVSRLGEPVMRGKAYVGNDLVDEVAKLKEVILFQDRVGPVHVHKNGSHNKFLDKVWVFAPYQKLEAVKERAFDCIEPGRKSILTVLTSNNHVTRNLFAFSIKSQFVSKPSKLKTEKLTLAFETKEEAQIWLDHVANQLATIRRKQKPSMDQGLSHLVVDNDSSEDGTEAQDQTPHAPDSMNHLTETQDQARINSDSGAERPVELPIQRSVFLSDPETPIRADNIGSHEIDSTTDGGMATPRGHGSLFDEEEDDAASLDERAVSLENLHAELRADSYIGADFYNWTVVRTNNNVTVLRGSGEHNAKSIMVSYIIRAPPRLCVKTVLKRDHHDIQKAQTTMHSEVIQTIDPFNDMLETTWRPSGIGALFLIPRKLIVQRLWRREDDGTYVIVFKSVEEQCEDRASLSRWLAPCIQMDSVMTFSPLTSEYCKTEESTETLVTVTSDLGSFKGMWHVRNPLEWLLKALYPFPFSHISSYIESVIEQSVAVRTRAEAARFSVKPFLGSQDSDIAERISNPLSSPSTSQPSTLPQIPPLPQIPENQTTRDLVRNMVKESRERVTREDPDFTSPVSSFATASVTFAEPEQGAQVEPSSKSDTSALPPVPREEESGNESTTEESEKPALTPEDVATCDKKYWLCVGHNKLKVRGKDYLTDKKKIPADDPVFQLVATDLMQVDQPTPHIARFLPSLKHSKAPFTFIMQIMFGHPSLSLTFSWAAPDPDSQRHLSRKLTKAMSRDIEPDSQSDWNAEEDDLHDKPFELTLARFLAGSTTDPEANKRRDGVVKLIPQISKGPWIVKQAVGTTPCLLGRKLNALYHRGPGYFEVDVDVNSSSVAANIVGIVQGVTKKLWVDMAIVLEGHSIEELPEVLLGSVRCAHLDLNSAKLLDTTTGEIRNKPGYE